MDLHNYGRFTEDLRHRLDGYPRVLGLVALGSMAGVERAPDTWSDHGFFVITLSSEQRWFRNNRLWLPDADQIVLFFQETPYGCKALYDSGHLIEFAVFDPDEISLARVNAYRVLIDRERIAERMRSIAEATATGARPKPAVVAGQFLTSLIVACGRDHRGETASARSMLTSAVRDLTLLMATRISAVGAAAIDNLDPLRRFESIYPETGEAIEAAMRLPVRPAAEALLDVFVHTVATSDELRAVPAVRAATR